MTRPVWFCQEFGQNGNVLVSVDQSLPNGTQVWARRVIHPFSIDEHPWMLRAVISEMSEVIGRVNAQPVSTSRACAFGGDL